MLKLVILIFGFFLPRLAGFKVFFISAVILIFGIQSYWTWQQYALWRDLGPPSRYLLPPYQPISYFARYSYMHFFNEYAISLGAALLFLASAKLLNRKFDRRFFEEQEPYLGALAIFVLGQPLWLYYLPLVLAAAAAASAYKTYRTYRTYRTPFYHLWLPAGILVLLINQFFLNLSNLF